jgi:hypothetical protein
MQNEGKVSKKLIRSYERGVSLGSSDKHIHDAIPFIEGLASGGITL